MKDLFLKELQQQVISNSYEALIGSTKRETFINLRNDQWFFTVPKKIEGTLSLYNNTEKIDPSYRTELLLNDFGTITLNEVADKQPKRQLYKTPLIRTRTNIISP